MSEKARDFPQTDTASTAVSRSLPFAPHTVPSSNILIEALCTDPQLGFSEEDANPRLSVYGSESPQAASEAERDGDRCEAVWKCNVSRPQ